jgi:hypothetical protein
VKGSASSALKFRINGVAYTRNFRLDGAVGAVCNRTATGESAVTNRTYRFHPVVDQ